MAVQINQGKAGINKSVVIHAHFFGLSGLCF
jgi:hypothetical protein